MSEKIGRVRIYTQNIKQGWITFADGSEDLPIYYVVLKRNGIEYLKPNQQVYVTISQKNGQRYIDTIEIVNNNKNSEEVEL